MESFRDQIIKCIQYADSETLAKLLSVRQNPISLSLLNSQHDAKRIFCRLPPAWIDLVEAYIKCISPYHNSQVKVLFANYKGMFNAFLRIFQTGDSSMLKLLYVMCDELWAFAKQVHSLFLMVSLVMMLRRQLGL